VSTEEKVMSYGCEGGGTTISRTSAAGGGYTFHFHGSSMSLDDDDNEEWVEFRSPPFGTLAEAIGAGSRSGQWVIMYPLFVHPDYHAEVLRLAVGAAQRLGPDLVKLWHARRADWERVCSVHGER
jgi:hypothetical protein